MTCELEIVVGERALLGEEDEDEAAALVARRLDRHREQRPIAGIASRARRHSSVEAVVAARRRRGDHAALRAARPERLARPRRAVAEQRRRTHRGSSMRAGELEPVAVRHQHGGERAAERLARRLRDRVERRRERERLDRAPTRCGRSLAAMRACRALFVNVSALRSASDAEARERLERRRSRSASNGRDRRRPTPSTPCTSSLQPHRRRRSHRVKPSYAPISTSRSPRSAVVSTARSRRAALR